MDITDSLVISNLAKCILNNNLKRLFLIVGRHRHLGAEKLIDQLRLQIRLFMCVVEHTVKICTPVIECRKQESFVRHVHNPVSDPVLYSVVFCVIA